MSKPLRLLIVEDSEADAALIVRAVREGGYDPVYQRVETAEALRKALAEDPWDVVLSDHAMPRFDSHAALGVVQEMGHGVPFIIVSGEIGEQAAVAAMKAGAHDYVSKDDLAFLVPTIEREIREAELRREKARLESQIRQAQKMQALGTLAGGIAHDLNNTLVPVLGLAELTLSELPQESLAHKNLEKIVAAAERAKKLVGQILAFTRQEESVRKPMRLQACIEDAFEMLRAMLPSTIEIRKRLDERLAPILADESQIQQLLMNLASNASDALGSKIGVIEISLERVEVDAKLKPVHTDLQPGPYAKLRFRDTGDGMDSETLERVLDPFFTTKPVGEGTGLGLSVVGGVVASHGGAITVSSEVGCGSTFDMYFPLMPTGAHETLQS